MKDAANRPLVLAVEDDPQGRALLEALLARSGYAVALAGDGAAFLELLDRESPAACLVDLGLPDLPGLELVRKSRARRPDAPVLVITGNGSLDAAVEAMKAGAADFLGKPYGAERLLTSLKNALVQASQAGELQRLRTQLRDAWSLDAIIGSSPAMRLAKEQARRLQGTEANVLVLGESGTGKELFARALHAGGSRAPGPFVDVNCAALSETLLESEIFGHEKGAFTGAVARRAGRFEQADGGTIFLDEIGDMPLPTQAKLLRVLQERRFQRVGGTESIQVDVRVVSATNREPARLVEEGRFRQDLLYRVNTVELRIPPLRERREDIPELARHFLAQAARRESRPAPRLADGALRSLVERDWPGNVRELENAMTRALVLSDDVIESIPGPAPAAPAEEPAGGGLSETVERMERRLILQALDKHGWVKARAARELGVTERILSYKVQNLGLSRNGTP